MSASDAPQTANTFTNDALGNDDATALAERIRRRDVSVTEVTQAAIDRLHKAEPLVHGVVAERYQQMLEAAAKLDRQPDHANAPFFTGVPTFIKDNTNVAGLPTRQGSAAVPAGHPVKHTSPFADQMLAQGYLCLGKTTMPEFGFNASTEPVHDAPPATPGTWHTPVEPHQVARQRSWQAELFPLPTPTMAAAPYEFLRPFVVLSGSSRPAGV